MKSIAHHKIIELIRKIITLFGRMTWNIGINLLSISVVVQILYKLTMTSIPMTTAFFSHHN